MKTTSYQKEWSKRTRQDRKDAGVCTACGKNPTAASLLTCSSCLSLHRDRSRSNHSEASVKWLQKVMRKFGMTEDDYCKAVVAAEGKCEICRQVPQRLYVDHDHETNHFRGLLCRDCNLALGQFKDNPQLLQVAIDYLKVEGC